MLFLQFLPSEMIELLLVKMQTVYDTQDAPLTQEVVNRFFRHFNGDLDTLDDGYADMIAELIESSDMKYTVMGVFTLVGKGVKITYNGIPLILPKMLVCEENG